MLNSFSLRHFPPLLDPWGFMWVCVVFSVLKVHAGLIFIKFLCKALRRHIYSHAGTFFFRMSVLFSFWRHVFFHVSLSRLQMKQLVCSSFEFPPWSSSQVCPNHYTVAMAPSCAISIEREDCSKPLKGEKQERRREMRWRDGRHRETAELWAEQKEWTWKKSETRWRTRRKDVLNESRK